MNTTLTIRVTQEDIDRGKVRKCKECPVARAIAREMPTACFSVASKYHVYFGAPHSKDGRRVKLPAHAINFITAFDDYGARAVSPFSFELTLPSALLSEVKG